MKNKPFIYLYKGLYYPTAEAVYIAATKEQSDE